MEPRMAASTERRMSMTGTYESMSRSTISPEASRKQCMQMKGSMLAFLLATGVAIIVGCSGCGARASQPVLDTGIGGLIGTLVRGALVRSSPAFPWPPPRASAETTIPYKWLPPKGDARLADVADALENALRTAKYPKWSYSSVPNGFALVSQMEQIRVDGTPSPEPARWSADLPRVDNMTLLEFVKALTNAQPGYYRVIVFIVTDQPWSRTGEKPTGKEAEQWLAKGFTWLPDSIGTLIYEPGYRTTALVYEFKKASKDTDAVFLDPSPISADDHLKKAGIADPLSRH